MSQVSSAKLKCAQLQIPHSTAASSGTTRTEAKLGTGPGLSKCFRSLFEEKLDKLRDYIAITSHYQCKVKSFSTADISAQANEDVECISAKKYLSECDLTMYSRHHQSSSRENNEYITYSCSTLAICGDTIHSSQLPSPQTQSIRQINSFIFSDLDLIKSVSRELRNRCIRARIFELVKCINLSSPPDSELENIRKLGSNVIIKPIQLAREKDRHFTTESGDILIQVVDYEDDKEKSHCVTKHDKEMFVLNWLQTVEAYPLDPE